MSPSPPLPPTGFVAALFRCHCRWAGDGADVEARTLVAKVFDTGPPTPTTTDGLIISELGRAFRAELGLYDHAKRKRWGRGVQGSGGLASGALRLPAFVGSAFDTREGRGVVLMEDLDERGGRHADLGGPLPEEDLTRAVKAVGAFHALHWKEGVGSASMSLTREGLAGEGSSQWPPRLFGPDAMARRREELRNLLEANGSRLRAEAPTGWAFLEGMAAGEEAWRPWGGREVFIHGDFAPNNLYFTNDAVVAVDWEKCGMGPPMWDLAVLLGTALTAGARRERTEEALQQYHEQIAGVAEGYSLEECREEYRRLLPCLAAWLLGTLGGLPGAEDGVGPREQDWEVVRVLALIEDAAAAASEPGGSSVKGGGLSGGEGEGAPSRRA
jgi:hypothetical protein